MPVAFCPIGNIADTWECRWRDVCDFSCYTPQQWQTSLSLHKGSGLSNIRTQCTKKCREISSSLHLGRAANNDTRKLDRYSIRKRWKANGVGSETFTVRFDIVTYVLPVTELQSGHKPQKKHAHKQKSKRSYCWLAMTAALFTRGNSSATNGRILD